MVSKCEHDQMRVFFFSMAALTRLVGYTVGYWWRGTGDWVEQVNHIERHQVGGLTCALVDHEVTLERWLYEQV